MIYLAPARDSFEYLSPESGDAVKAKIFYSLGFFRQRRGIHMSLTTVTKHADGHLSYMAGAMASVLLLPLERKSQKTLIRIAEELDREIPTMADEYRTFRGGPLRRAQQMVEELFKAKEAANGTA